MKNDKKFTSTIIAIGILFVFAGYTIFASHMSQKVVINQKNPDYLEFCLISFKNVEPAALVLEKGNCPVGMTIYRAEIMGTSTLTVSK